MLAETRNEPFDSKDWYFELKLDGYRIIAVISEESVHLFSRNFKLYDGDFPGIVAALKKYQNVVLDGEIVGYDKSGNQSFQSLQESKREPSIKNVYYIFDILYDQEEIINLPLLERKKKLKRIDESDLIKKVDFIEEDGVMLYDLVKSINAEGIMAKKKDSLYTPGTRSNFWLKIPYRKRMEVAIVGYTLPRPGRTCFSSLLVARKINQEFQYIGNVGTGFSDKLLKNIFNIMQSLVSDIPKVENPPKLSQPIIWTKPKLVAEIEYKEITNDEKLRQPSFIRIREDKDASEI